MTQAKFGPHPFKPTEVRGLSGPCEICSLGVLADVHKSAPNTVEVADPMIQSANTWQVGGDHYKSRQIQPWDFIVANNLGFLDGNVVKYVTRFRNKGGIEDLKKARHYLDKLIEVESQR